MNPAMLTSTGFKLLPYLEVYIFQIVDYPTLWGAFEKLGDLKPGVSVTPTVFKS